MQALSDTDSNGGRGEGVRLASQPLARRSLAIDGLRGLAVAMVMCAHLPFSRSGFVSADTSSVFPRAGIAEVMARGHYGVQLFLVISGYCIHMRWAAQPDRTARIGFFAFWRRRLTRLYPPYVAIVAISVAITLAAARFFPASVPSFSLGQLGLDVLVLLLLLQNLTDAGTRVGNPPFWSLALEEQLYLLYFPLLALRRSRGWVAALSFSLIVTLAWYAAGALTPSGWHHGWYRAGPAYWFAWALGALAAEAHVGLVRLPGWCRSPWTFAGFFGPALLVKGHAQALLVTVSFFFLIGWATRVESSAGLGRWTEPLIRLGKISYGVYLVHNLAFIVVKKLLVAVGLAGIGILLLRAGAGVLAGYIVYRLLEVPFLRLSQRVKIPMVPTVRAAPPAQNR